MKKTKKISCWITHFQIKPQTLNTHETVVTNLLTIMRFPLTWAGSDVHKPRRQWTKNWPRPPYSLFTWKLKLPWETRWLWELFVVSIWACISTDKSTGQVFRNRITRELSLGLDELEIQQFSVTTCTGTTKSNNIWIMLVTCHYSPNDHSINRWYNHHLHTQECKLLSTESKHTFLLIPLTSTLLRLW